MNVTSIEVTYCTNYNGAYMYVNGGISDDEMDGEQANQIQSIRTNIVDALVDDCSKYGEFMGDEDDAEELIVKLVKEQFPDATVTVVFDGTSS